MADAFKRAAFPGRGDWWKEFGRWFRKHLTRAARRRMKQRLKGGAAMS